jgi:2-dehydro-3-deoxyphosphooctonate aldolase (KDO 8-P synthase)
MSRACHLDQLVIGPDQPLVVIAGPCVLEEPATNSLIGRTLRDCCARLGLGYIFKASFDKANRSSGRSPRGPGLGSGLRELARLRADLGVPVTSDIHEPAQADDAARVLDLLQVPAFLCRQTDLLLAAAATGRAVNVKKGQFMAPAEMAHVVSKLVEGGCKHMLLTERGTFFGYHRLVNDFIGLGDLMDMGRPVCFDITHSTQLPGGAGATSGGRPDRARLLGLAAVAAGVDAVFIEAHPDPPRARSDPATTLSLEATAALLEDLARVASAVRRPATPATPAARATPAALPAAPAPPARAVPAGARTSGGGPR